MRVLAALSGGVDSSVAAARAVAAGHEVVGVHLALSRTRDALRSGSRGCCSREDAADAARVADVLGIPYYVWDLSEEFAEDVVEDFVASYAAGETPNPCLRCNEKIKFAAVLDRALALGFDAVCTGHYARLEGGVLRRATDAGKDQSYVLAVLTRSQLDHSIFPLGGSTKADVRLEAARRGLAVADKPDEGLPKIAAATGGGYFELTTTNDLGATFAKVADELHHQYALGFTPEKLDGKMHALEVRLSADAGAGMTVRARKSYLAKVAGRSS